MFGHRMNPVIRKMAMNSIENNMKAVRTFTRIFKNEHDVDGIDHLFAWDFKHNFAPPLKPGLGGFKDIGRMMNHAFPDVVVTEEDLISNDSTVVERSSAAATHQGEFMGTSPTGRRIRWTEIHIYRFVDGKIAEHWVELSMLHLLQQIGAMPSPDAK
jgi:predicted ester cyclase